MMNTARDFTTIPYRLVAEKTGIKMQDYDEGIYFQNIPDSDAVYSYPDQNAFAVYKGDTKMEDLNFTLPGYGADGRAVLVIGNLIVKSTINMFGKDVGYPMYLYVTGNLQAENLLISTLADVIVRGDILIQENLYAVDINCGNLYCGGNYTGKNVYIEKSGMLVKGKMTVENLYYYINIVRGETEASLLEELNIEITNETEINTVPCGESGIRFFDEMSEIEEGIIDLDDISYEDETRIDNLYLSNRIFIDELYKGNDLYSHKVAAKIMDGIKVFK